MDPKFQSSFIPKGPAASPIVNVPAARGTRSRGLFYLLALGVFSISVLLAFGVFGYKYYLKYRIDKMGSDLETAKATLESETISELTRLNDRIVSTESLIDKHTVLTPLFEFLEVSTPQTVRFSDFSYTASDKGIELNMKGEARGYAALALQADIFSKNPYFRNSIFSNLVLNEKGDVVFNFKTALDPSLVSYKRDIERLGAPPITPAAPIAPIAPIITPASTSTSGTTTSATSSPQN